MHARRFLLRPALLLACAIRLALPAPAAEPGLVLKLWPDQPPGETAPLGEEHDTTTASGQLIAGRRVIRLGNVSQPTLSIYRPPAHLNTGAAVLVCPGGGYHILAMDLEGTEVCEWLNSIGVTAALLKYRVPKREGVERHVLPLQDAQRAMGLLRARATDLGIHTNRIGALGFSAGGHLIAALATSAAEGQPARTYPAIDASDSLGCRPDFAVSIYPGGLVLKDQGDRLAPSVAVGAGHPPTFLAMAADDPVRVENAVAYFMGLKQAGVPAELHVYPAGGHGYGLRRTELPVTTWPDRAADWLRHLRMLDR